MSVWIEKAYIMKHIIMFKGGVETLEFFSEQIADYLNKQGYEIFWYNLFLSESSFDELFQYYNCYKADDFVALTFNFEGIEGEAGLYQSSDRVISCANNMLEGYFDKMKLQSVISCNFWDYAKIRVVNIVVDHPLYYHKYLNMLPSEYIQINIDRLHVAYMNRFYPEVKTYFIPSAGTEVNKDRKAYSSGVYIPVKDRPIDIIFTGNYTPKHILRERIDNLEQDYIDFYENILSDLIAHPDMTIDEVAQKHLRGEFGDLMDEQLKDCMPGMMYVDLNARFHYRELAIRALVDSGLKVHTYGEGYNYIRCEHTENIIQHGSVNSQQCLDKISQAKISLNVMPWFKDGAHDRVFNSCLNGAVSLTDSSIYMNEIFTDGMDILFYDLNMLRDYEISGYNQHIVKPLTDRVRMLLSDDVALQNIADRAYDLCQYGHSWSDVAMALINYALI